MIGENGDKPSTVSMCDDEAYADGARCSHDLQDKVTCSQTALAAEKRIGEIGHIANLCTVWNQYD